MLTAQENFQLVKLLDKLEWPVTPEVFDALCVNFVTSPIELAVIRRGEKEQEVLMIYREDKFFNGWHIPGSVILPGRTIELVLSALVRREVGIEIHDPFRFKFIKPMQFMMGNGLGQCARGQETSLLYTLFIGEGETVGVNEKKQFFPFNEIPDDTLPHHKVLIAAVGHSFIGGSS